MAEKKPTSEDQDTEARMKALEERVARIEHYLGDPLRDCPWPPVAQES